MRSERSTITLCDIDGERNVYLNQVLNVALGAVACSEILGDATVILTGSLSRGEASVIKDRAGFRSLSDMEFLISKEVDLPLRVLCAEAGRIETEANRIIASANLQCKIEFTYALERFYRTAKPSIFAYELKSHGKVVSGSPEALNLMRAFSPDEIPQIDAFYLMCNRIIEQLESLKNLCSSSVTIADGSFRYGILKFYMDIATSLLVFCGRYTPSYRTRRDVFLSLDRAALADIPAFDFIQERVDYWTSVKLSPTVDSLGYKNASVPVEEWRELAELALPVWQWELRRLLVATNDPLSTVVRKFRSWGTFGGVLRERLKYIRRAASGSSNVPLRFLAGNPRHALYVESSDLYRRIAWSIQKSCVGGSFDSIADTDVRQIEDMVRIWSTCFRNA